MMKEKRHTFQGLFIFLLLGVFAVMSTMLVLYSARVYNKTVERSERNNIDRIMRSFVSSAARTGDEEGTFYVGFCNTGDGRRVDYIERYDCFTDGDMNEQVYVTRLYCDDGKLWETYAPADKEQIGRPVDYPTLTGKRTDGAGQEDDSRKGYALWDAIAFRVDLSDDGLLQASIADKNGVYKVKIALRTSQFGSKGGDLLE